jgi:rod shape-determining protein MreC
MNERGPIGGRLASGRRTSFARRDTNLALVGALVSGVVLAFAVLLLVLARVDPDQGTRVRGAVLDLLSPVIKVVSLPVKAVRTAAQTLSDHWQVVERNRALEAEIAAARARAAQADALAEEVARLDALLKLRRPERRLVASGMASAASGSPSARLATLSVGRRDGVRPRMPVLAPDGLAGRIQDAGLTASRVMLVSDANSRVPVKVERTGWPGIAQGTGAVDLLFQYDPASATDRLRVGDRLVTSGDGGLFPPGIPVAVIIDTQANPPRARPFVRPSALGAMAVEAPWLPPPEVEPTDPAPDEADRPISPPPPATAPPPPA